MRGRVGVLEWLARVRVAGVEPIAQGMGISERRVRGHGEALERDRLLVRRRIGDGGGAILAITPRGLREAGYRANSRTTTSSLAGLLHGRGVSWIAAHCERRGRPWLGPAELRSEGWPLRLADSNGDGPRTHMPDLGFLLEGTERWAVEFERMPKSRPRLERILAGYRAAELAGELASVLYVCADESIVRLVQSVAAEVGLDRAVRTLDWVVAETRAQANPG